MENDKEKFKNSVFASKVKMALPREIERFNAKQYETFFTTDVPESIEFFDSFLKTETRHVSFLKSFNSSNPMIVKDLMGYVLAHAKSRNISNYTVIHEMVLFEAVKILPDAQNLTDKDLSFLAYGADARIEEIFNNLIKNITTEVPELFQTILNDSFEYIRLQTEKKIQDLKIQLPDVPNNIENINEYVDVFSMKLQDTFTNKNILSNLNSNNHGFSFIKNVPIEIIEKKIIYKNFSDALINGFVDMYLLNTYANREGRNLVVKYIKNIDSLNRDSIFKFQVFIQQNKSNSQHMPFKYLKNFLNLTEDEITGCSRFFLNFQSKNLGERLNNLIIYSYL